MVPLTSLWMPILVSALIVFVASSVIHMVLPYHRSDLRKLPKEDEVMEALRRFKIPPGDYTMPCAGSMEAMKKPEFIDKMKAGPVALITVVPSGPPSMSSNLVQWFLYAVVVGVFAAYITGRALGSGANYLQVFRFAGCTAFLGYSLALLQNSIWYKRNWGTTIKSMLDGLVYGLLTAGTFGWLWPRTSRPDCAAAGEERGHRPRGRVRAGRSCWRPSATVTGWPARRAGDGATFSRGPSWELRFAVGMFLTCLRFGLGVVEHCGNEGCGPCRPRHLAGRVLGCSSGSDARNKWNHRRHHPAASCDPRPQFRPP